MILSSLYACGSVAGNSTVPLTHISQAPGYGANAATVQGTGAITNMISGGFTLQGGPGLGYVHVYVTGSTIMSGPPPKVGATALVVGTGSFATSITATSVTVSQGQGTAAVPVSTAVVASGPIGSFFSGGFTMYAGKNVGNIQIHTAGATIGGGKVQVGSYAQVTGAGTLATSITASYVALSTGAPGPVSLTGTVGQTTPYGFTENVDAAHPAVPIALNALTVIGGGTLATGAQVTVSGTGSETVAVSATRILVASPSPSPGASPTPTPAPIAMTHVLTMDYLGGKNGTTTVSPQAAARYLTWAETDTADANALSAAGIKTIYYIDANRTQTGDTLQTNDETTYAHDCNNNRVTDTYSASLTQTVMDPGSPSLQALFANYVASIASQAHFDAIFEDDAGALSAFAPYAPFSAMPCNYSDAQWIASGIVLNSAPSLPVLFNGLSGLNGHGISMSTAFLPGSNTIGGTYEGCYSANDQAKMNGWLWNTIENSELATVSAGKIFNCLQTNNASAASQTDARLYAYASFLLTYDPTRDMIWEMNATPSGLHVMPESTLVAMHPLVAEPAQINALQLTGGAYGRQYAQCYIAGAFVGACAVAVNPGPSAVPFPFVQYQHSLVLNGSGIIDGGSISTTGAAPTTLGPSEAAIVFP